jgi:hypothetical protein
VTERGLARVEAYLQRFFDSEGELDLANAAMLARLKEGKKTPIDLNFYEHELIESELVEGGIAEKEAHLTTLAKQGIPREPGYETQLYQTDIILKYGESFSSAARSRAEAAKLSEQ